MVTKVDSLIKDRNKVLFLFETSGLNPVSDVNGLLNKMLQKYGLDRNHLPDKKIDGDYTSEYVKLWEMIQDVLVNIGKPEIANKFGRNVSKGFNSESPTAGIAYLATLLKGSSNPIVKNHIASKYDKISALKGTMVNALRSKGIVPPDSLDDIAKLFYNNFAAVKSNYNYEPKRAIDFDSLSPEYHVDEALIDGLVAYVKSLQDQKNSGVSLPPTLDKIATSANKVQENLTQIAQEKVSTEVGKNVIANSAFIGIAVLAFLVLIGYAVAK